MKKTTIANIFIATLLIILIVFCGVTAYKNNHISPDRAEQVYVYITKTGACYHDEDCRHLEYSKVKISLEEAAKEYRRCSICKPPIIKNDE